MSGSLSAERIIAILGLFTEDRPEWAPEDMMRELDYTRPTIYRYLKALKEAGLIVSMPNAGFTLGPRVVEMDYLMRKSDPLVHHGQPYLAALAASWPCSAFLARWYGNRILCVTSECSTPNPISSYPRGRPMPLARGAISRTIMAHLPRRALAPMVRDNLDDLRAAGLGATLDEIVESLRPIRRSGVAVAHGEVTPGVTGVAAPIFDTGRSPVAVLCVTIADAQAGTRKVETICGRVRDAAGEITTALAGLRNDGQAGLRRSA